MDIDLVSMRSALYAAYADQVACVAGVDMLSPGVMHARKYDHIEWMLLDLLDPQREQEYPAGYEEVRRRLVGHLLSMTAAPQNESEYIGMVLEATADARHNVH